MQAPGPETQNADLARRWLREIWDQRREATVHEVMHPDAVGHLEGLTTRGIPQFLEARAYILNAFSDFKVVAEQVLAQDENVIFRWVASGTHDGPLMDVPPTRKHVTFRGMTWQRFENGKLVEGWDCWNQGQLMAELQAHAAAASQGIPPPTA